MSKKLLPVKLYIDWASQPSRAVAALCHEAKIPHEIIEIRIAKHQNLTPEFARIHPIQKIPVIHDQENDFKLFESHAIMRYLFSLYNAPEHLYPSDLKQRALVDCYLDWHHSNTRKASQYVFKKAFSKKIGERKLDQSEEELENSIKRSLEFIENYYLQQYSSERAYLQGLQKISIADFSCYCELQQMQFIRFDFSSYKNISEWRKRVQENEGIQYAHTKFNTLLEKFLSK